MPGINDAPEQLQPLLEAADEAGATSISGVALHLRGEVRQIFMEWLAAKRPDLLPRYRDLYRHGAYAPRRERERLAGLVRRPGARQTRPWRAAAERTPRTGREQTAANARSGATAGPAAPQQRLF